jgi:hypothetical protein
MSNNRPKYYPPKPPSGGFAQPMPPPQLRPPLQPHNNRPQQQQQFVKQPEEIVINDDDDDDLLDISDTELIRASQAVESSLIFTNNVHHATSNAINIFSQFTANKNNNVGGNDDAQLMGPPTQFPPSTLYSNTNRLMDADAHCDDLKLEVNKLKTENMQKEGEVKILRGGHFINFN